MRFTGLSEFLWYLLLFGGLILFNIVMQRRSRRARERRLQQQAGQAQPPEPPPEASWGRVALPRTPDALADSAWGRAPVESGAPPLILAPERATGPPAARPLPPGSRRRVQTLAPRFRSRQDLRQAVVALTVLGPCRALQPYGDESRRPGRSE